KLRGRFLGRINDLDANARPPGGRRPARVSDRNRRLYLGELVGGCGPRGELGCSKPLERRVGRLARSGLRRRECVGLPVVFIFLASGKSKTSGAGGIAGARSGRKLSLPVVRPESVDTEHQPARVDGRRAGLGSRFNRMRWAALESTPATNYRVIWAVAGLEACPGRERRRERRRRRSQTTATVARRATSAPPRRGRRRPGPPR